MMRSALLFPLMLLAGCAASPLYVDRGEVRGTMAEIPRDARGEPLWAAIRPARPLPGEPQQEMMAAKR